MAFTDRFKDLRRRSRGLESFTFALGIVGCAAMFAALALWPGGYGEAGKFNSIHIPDSAVAYFSGLGVRFKTAEIYLFAGQRMQNAALAFLLAKLFSVVALAASALRRQFRRAAIFAVLLVVLQFGGEALRTRVDALVAYPREFGFRFSPDPSGPVQPLQQQSAAMDSGRSAPGSSREDEIAKTETILASDLSAFPAEQRSAMHYVGAQIAYLKFDPARTAVQLSAIAPGALDPDADWRIRGMREYVQAQGFRVRLDAYRPTRGLPFLLARLLSAIFWWFALALFGVGLVGRFVSWIIRRRIRRIQSSMAALGAMSGTALG